MPIQDTDVIQMTFVQDIQGVRLANVFYLQPNAALPDANVDAEMQDIIPKIWNDFSAGMSTINVLRAVVVRVPTNPPQPTRAYTFSLPGDLPGDGLPSSKVIVIRHQSIPWSRSAAGRYFVSGVAEALVTKNSLTDAGVLVFADFANMVAGGGVLGLIATWRFWHYSPKNDDYAQIRKVTVIPNITVLRSRQSDLLTFT